MFKRGRGRLRKALVGQGRSECRGRVLEEPDSVAGRFCLFCLNTAPEVSPLFSNPEVVGAVNCVELQRQLQKFFVLRKVLELPFHWCEQKLPGEEEDGGDDDKFINFYLCHHCFDLVEACWGLYQTVLSLQSSLEETKQKLKRKVIESQEEIGRPVEGDHDDDHDHSKKRKTTWLAGEIRHYFLRGGIEEESSSSITRTRLRPEEVAPEVDQDHDEVDEVHSFSAAEAEATDTAASEDDCFADLMTFIGENKNDEAENYVPSTSRGKGSLLGRMKRKKIASLRETRRTITRRNENENQRAGRSRSDLSESEEVVENIEIEGEGENEDDPTPIDTDNEDEDLDFEEERKGKRKRKKRKPKPNYYSFFCDLCPSKFHRRWKLEQHQAQHEAIRLEKKDGGMECDVCGYPCDSERALKRHTNLKHKKPTEGNYRCKKCDFVTARYYLLENHVKEKHPSVPGEECGLVSLECDICHHTLANLGSLNRHRKQMHPELFQLKKTDQLLECGQCGERFDNVARYESHLKSHKQKPLDYTCEQCGKSYPYKARLKQHMKLHGEKRWICAICGIDYIHKSSLGVHYTRHHPGMEPFPVSTPPLKPEDVERAKVVKMFKCRICSQKMPAVFRRRHMRQHMVESGTGFSCDQCDRTYTRLQALRKHKEINHSSKGSQEAKCPYCFKTFIHPEYVTAHFRYCQIKIGLDNGEKGTEGSEVDSEVVQTSQSEPLPTTSTEPENPNSDAEAVPTLETVVKEEILE